MVEKKMTIVGNLVSRWKSMQSGSGVSRPQSRYLRDGRSRVLSTRPAILTDSRDAVRAAWRRSAGLAMDLIQNSGRLSGAADQVIADTVGSELELAPKPDVVTMKKLGYDEKEIADFIALVKREWKWWAWNPAECDFRGKLTVPQMIDVGLRWDMAFGEITQIVSYMGQFDRDRYGIQTGTKVLMVPPSRLVQDTSEVEGMFQGVIHDTNGRATHYRFAERNSGINQKQDYPSFDDRGMPVVSHIFDPKDADDVRGISRIAPAFRKYIQREMLDDATAQTALLQTVFAATLSSTLPSAEAFDGLEVLKEAGGNGLGEQFSAMIAGALERAQNENGVGLTSDPQINYTAPGEDLKFHSSNTPGPQYQPFAASLDREMARAIGITYESFTLDNAGATYSSSRVGNSSIWPVVVRRRERISAPQSQTIYEAFIDEAIGTGKIPFKGGYRAFCANRDKICWTQWRGPEKPSADDDKSARASAKRLENKTSSLEIESALLGHPHDELFEAQVRDHKKYKDAGMASPYDPKSGADGNSEIESLRVQIEELQDQIGGSK